MLVSIDNPCSSDIGKASIAFFQFLMGAQCIGQISLITSFENKMGKKRREMILKLLPILIKKNIRGEKMLLLITSFHKTLFENLLYKYHTFK